MNGDTVKTEALFIYLPSQAENMRCQADQLADELGIPVVCEVSGETEGVYLKLDEGGLSLNDGKQEIRADLTSMLPRLRPANLQREFLVKAVKIKSVTRQLRVFDATAGMGEDSLILAAAGCDVHLYELDPVIAALLKDALRRGADVPELAEAVGRMHLTQGDSIAAMRRFGEEADGWRPDVVLLDPMFPQRQKSALVKKKFQLIHQLEKPCSDEEEMVDAAIAARPVKIVIKRPVKGAYLAGRKPGYSIEGKAIRYDCTVFPENM